MIVSRELLSFVDYLISFPYLFVFYFLIVVALKVVGNQKIGQENLFSI